MVGKKTIKPNIAPKIKTIKLQSFLKYNKINFPCSKYLLYILVIMLSNYKVEVLIKENEIKKRIKSLSKEINSFYKDSKKLLVVGLLRGSFVFIADLSREINIPVEVDFMTVSSYGNSMTSSQNIRILSDLNTDIKNIDVLLVEDIIDTGHTLYQVIKILNSRKPNSLEVCCLLNKSSRRETNLDVRWSGFNIPDEFVVGYGIDYAQNNRNLPYIGKVIKPQ